ncbi:MAG: ATPase, T2SS/T4P/T4SS family [Candidatus Micrarchaeia archaeon]|jgi:flagellar protein FlaI
MEKYEERKIRPRLGAKKEDATGALGWIVGNWKCDYKVGLPELSSEEREVVREVAGKYREQSSRTEFEDREEIKREVARLLAVHCEETGLLTDAEQQNYLARATLSHVYGFSGLDELLNDDELEEIAVVGMNKPVFVYHRKNGWMKTNCMFTDGDAFVDVVNKMARTLGRRITLQSPRLNAILPDKSRLHASIPPISNYELTIRKFRENPIHVADLLAYRTYSADALAYLWLAVQSDSSVIVSGNTASGKTSTLNALFQFISLRERILVTEETPEINIPHENQVKLLSSSELGVVMKDLIADSLRMRPDRVIVGEARSHEEAHSLVETLTSGQARGSYATFHAQSARETLVRLRSLGVLASDLQSIDLVVVQRRMMRYDAKNRGGKEVRRCVEISEIVRGPEGEETALPALNQIYKYGMKADRLERTAAKSLLMERVRESFGMNEKEFGAEVKKRVAFLKSLDVSASFSGLTEQLQKFAYDDYEEPAPLPKAAGIAFFSSTIE